MNTRPLISLVTLIAAALLLSTTGTASAQETKQQTTQAQQQTQARAEKANIPSRAQASQNQDGAARKLGPGDGLGNQGVQPQDGTGNGSAGRL